MSDNKPKVPATGLLEISISGGENLQGRLVGQLVFDKDNPFTAEILQGTSAPAVFKIKDASPEAVKEEPVQESDEYVSEEIIDLYSEQYSSPRTSVLATKTNQENNDETRGLKFGKKGRNLTPFQVLSHPTGKVHCNSCPECLSGGCDSREDYNSTEDTSGPESACIWQNLSHNINPFSKKDRMAAGGALTEGNDDCGFNESYISNCTSNQPDCRDKTNDFPRYIQDYPMYQDSNRIFSEDEKVCQKPVTPIKQNHFQPNSHRYAAGCGGGMACSREYCCNNMGDYSSNICNLGKDLNCQTHDMRSASCCSVAENIQYARDDAYKSPIKQEYLPNKYCRINDAHFYPSRNPNYPQKFEHFATGKYLCNDFYPQYCNAESPKFTDFYGDSLIPNTGRQRAGADNPAKANETVLSSRRSAARAAHKAKFCSKCANEINENEEVGHLLLNFSSSEIDPCPSTSKIRKTCRLRAGMDRGNQEFNRKFKYSFVDNTVCGTYDIVEMKTLEDLNVIAPSKPPEPPQLPCPRPAPPPQPTGGRAGMDATYRTRAGLDTSVQSLNSKMNLSRKSEDFISRSSVKTEHLRAGMDCISPGSFKSRSLDNKKQNHLELIAFNSVENVSLNTISDINAFGDTKSNCGHAQSSSMSSAISNKYKDELHAYDFPIVEKPCKKSSEVTDLLAGMDFKSGISLSRNPEEFSQFTNHYKNSSGTCDLQELETPEDLILSRPPPATKQGPNAVSKSLCTCSSGKESNDLNYVALCKYRNLDKSCDGEVDVQEGEQKNIRLFSVCYPEAHHNQAAFQPRPKCSKVEMKLKCSYSNNRHSCATHTSARPQSPLGYISSCPAATLVVNHCHTSCSHSPSSSPCPSPCHSATSIICIDHHKEKKHCKTDVLSNFREIFPNLSFDYCPDDAESDSRASEISGLLKQEIMRLGKVNEDLHIPAHRCSTDQNLSKQFLIYEGGRTISHSCNARGSPADGKNLHLSINRLVNDCAFDVKDSVRKKIIEDILEFVCSNSDWLNLNFPKVSGDENIRPASTVNFEESGTFNSPLKDKGSREQDMTIPSLEIT